MKHRHEGRFPVAAETQSASPLALAAGSSYVDILVVMCLVMFGIIAPAIYSVWTRVA